MNERRLDMGFRFLETLQTANIGLSAERRAVRQQLTPALINFSYIYGTYGRFRHFQDYMAWMTDEITGIGELLNAPTKQRRLTERELEDLHDTLAVMISSTLDWMMMDDPQNWRPSTDARNIRRAERGESAEEEAPKTPA